MLWSILFFFLLTGAIATDLRQVIEPRLQFKGLKSARTVLAGNSFTFKARQEQLGYLNAKAWREHAMPAEMTEWVMKELEELDRRDKIMRPFYHHLIGYNERAIQGLYFKRQEKNPWLNSMIMNELYRLRRDGVHTASQHYYYNVRLIDILNLRPRGSRFYEKCKSDITHPHPFAVQSLSRVIDEEEKIILQSGEITYAHVIDLARLHLYTKKRAKELYDIDPSDRHYNQMKVDVLAERLHEWRMRKMGDFDLPREQLRRLILSSSSFRNTYKHITSLEKLQMTLERLDKHVTADMASCLHAIAVKDYHRYQYLDVSGDAEKVEDWQRDLDTRYIKVNVLFKLYIEKLSRERESS